VNEAVNGAFLKAESRVFRCYDGVAEKATPVLPQVSLLGVLPFGGIHRTTGRTCAGAVSYRGGTPRVLCRYCGTENPGIHRFCGMCGREIEPEGDLGEEIVPEPVSARPAPARAEIPKPVATAPPPPTTAPVPPKPAPAYTGGIFNLGAPAEQSSRNLDYLLEDDEPRSHKGLFLGFIALVLALGLGYMRFRQTGIPGLRSLSTPATQSAPTNATPAPSNGAETSTAIPAPPATTPDQAPAAQPSPSTATSTAPAAATQTTTAPPANSPPAGTPAPATTTPAAPAPDSAGQSAATGQDGSNASTRPPAATQTQPLATTPAPAPKQEAVPEKPADEETPAASAAAAPDVAAPPKPAKKPAAKPPAAKAEDSVALGEKYLYGRGVPQSCEKGLHYMKPAADQSNQKAMITMGALYATGHCLSRDLPTAYRYFALALRQDPENSALKQNTESVWGQMTPSERQLAIRLTH
jgi:hypothetical protein